MLNFIRDKIRTVRLKARYQRLVQERVLNLIEATGPQPVSEDPGQWQLMGDGKSGIGEVERTDARSQARRLVVENPHARNVLRLLEIYVVGPDLHLNHVAIETDNDETETIRAANRLWMSFLENNGRHFTYREFARRTWRDGECLLRLFSQPDWPPTVRFIDPETIGPTTDQPDSQGILTAPEDVETPLAYLRLDPASGQLAEQIPASEILHTRIGVDSNQKRGVTIFAPLAAALDRFDGWLETELMARKLQASIVLWRKVQGSPSQAGSFADAAQTGSFTDTTGTTRHERFRPGTILTTSQGTELEYLQPNTNFEDAAPLGRMLLLCVAAGAGLPEFMLTSDASNANFASTMVAEGPAVKLFQSEQRFFAAEFTRVWRWVMSEAIRFHLLPDDFFDRVAVDWTFPKLATRDRPRERLADARLVDSKILSRAEVARRDDADPALMQSEITEETSL